MKRRKESIEYAILVRNSFPLIQRCLIRSSISCTADSINGTNEVGINKKEEKCKKGGVTVANR